MCVQSSPKPVPGNPEAFVIVARSRDGHMTASEPFPTESGAEFAKEAYLFFGYTAAIFPLLEAKELYPDLFQ